MQTILVAVHLLVALGLIGLVLIQHGKGADAGAAFGSGASGTVFGARGSGSFLSRSTALLAALFFLSSMGLGYFAMQTPGQQGIMEVEAPAPATEIPAPPPAASGGIEVPLVPSEETASEVPVPQE